MRISPAAGSQSLRRRSASVVLPAPDGPTSAVTLPGLAVKLMPCRTSRCGV